jgi:ceramide glucosyltransferase
MDKILFAVWGLLLVANLASIVLAARRLSSCDIAPAKRDRRPPVSIVIPLRGVEAFTGETLAHAFRLDWPSYELVFCVADATDPVIPEVVSACAANPGVPARLLTGDDRISANPKLNNCYKGWQAARHEWVVLADSNVLMPADYLERLMAAWQADTGLACSMPLASRPRGFWAEVECAFLNGHQVRWQYASEALGRGFAQGKSMLWYKPMLDGAGGIGALSAEIAEDAASTKLVNGLGRKVRLVNAPFEQPLGRRTLSEVWTRQGRWSRLRRVTFPARFAPEILAGALPPLVVGLAAAALAGIDPVAVAAFTVLALYLPELALAWSRDWHVSVRSLPAMVVRDLMLPAIWWLSLIDRPFNWRGNTMTIGTHGSELEMAPRSQTTGA